MSISKIIIVLIFGLLTRGVYGNGGKGIYIWPKYEHISVPDSLKSEMAFYIENVTTIDFMQGFETSLVIFKRIYINSKEAADTYSKKEIFVGNGGDMPMISARTLKKDGRIVVLDGDQIIETHAVTKNKYGKKVARRIQLVYPELEVGDVIDLAYQLDFQHYIYSDLLSLEDDLPSIHSRITLRNMSLLDITAFSLNTMPNLVTKVIDGVRTVTWESTSVAKRYTDYFNALSPKAPFAIFILWRPNIDLNYSIFYDFDNLNYPIDQKGSFYLTKYLVENEVIKENDDKFIILKKALEYFENDFIWEKTRGDMPIMETFKKLKEKKIDEVLYTRYVHKLLTELEIPFEKGFTKSLLNGRFEHGFVSLEQMDQRFIVLYDKDNNAHFLFPPSNKGQFYLLDEIPFYNEGNQSIVLSGTDKGLKDQVGMLLPESDAETNTQYSSVLVSINKDDSVRVKRKDVFNGHYSYLTRNENRDSWLKELGVVTDSVQLNPIRINQFYPYEIEFLQDSLMVDILEQIDDSLFWLTLQNLLPNGVYQRDELNGQWSDYVVLPFTKKNEISFFIKNESPIQVAEELKEIFFLNKVGSIHVKAIQMNPNLVKLTYLMQVNKRYLSGSHSIQEFVAFMKKYEEIRNKKWIFSFS